MSTPLFNKAGKTDKEMKEMDVLVVGELNIDLILNTIKGFPRMGTEILADEMTITLGSSSAIFANNLSRLGSRVGYLGKVGRDQFASQVCTTLEAAGVDTSHIMVSEAFRTGLTVALNYDNDRAMVTHPGAMNDLRIGDVSDDALGAAAHMHLSSVFLQEALKPDIIPLFKRAKELGLTTSFDPQWDPHEKWDLNLEELLPHVDVFLPNAMELKQFTGKESIREGLKTLKPFCNVVVVKNGTKGALMWDGKELWSQAAFLNSSVVDAIGAGDSFNAGFICKFTQHKPLRECLEFAALTGAINTTAPGGTAAFLSTDKIRKTAKEQFNFEL